jgi:hypothetical protein
MKKIFIVILLILISKSAYCQWGEFKEQNSGVSTELNSSACQYGSLGQTLTNWVCGNNGVVLRSKSNDSVWISTGQNGIPSNVNLVNICAYDSMIALTAGNIGSNTIVYRTTNKGMNWSQVFSQSGGYINAISFSPVGPVGYMIGNPVGGRWSIWKSSNAGLNWDSTGLYLTQTGAENGYNNCMKLWGGLIYFGTNNSRIYKSTSGGTNWQVKLVNQTSVYSIWADYNNYIIAGGTNIIISQDGGNNWTTIIAPGTGNITGLAFADKYWGYFVRGNEIYRTNNLGNSWYLYYTAPSGIYKYINNSPIYTMYTDIMGVRNNGGISKNSLALVGIENNSQNIIEKFSLYQNYPNPFNPTTKIRFSVPSGKFSIPPLFSREGLGVSLIVYDITGKEIAVLVNKELSTGEYEVEFNGTNYPSGIYFYSLKTESSTQTRKMVLLK